MHLLFELLLLVFSKCDSLQLEDFYDYTSARILTDFNIHIDLPITYPHWSDVNNTQIDIVQSGIIRFSGLNSANTLDLLVLATSSPISGNIFYQVIQPVSDTLKENISRDIEISSFNALHAVIITWQKVEFYSKSFSSFQVIVTSNGTDTFAILNLLNIGQSSQKLQFYPEVDLRYSYNGGLSFVRTGFLKRSTGVSTATVNTASAATSGTNTGKPGRWVLQLNQNIMLVETSNSSNVTSNIQGMPLSNFSGIALRGEFWFNNLTLDGSILLSFNVNQLGVILAKSSSDPRYDLMDGAIKQWISSVYSNVTNATDSTVNIVSYRMGSLIVDYFVSLKNPNCGDSTSSVCADGIMNRVINVTKESIITSGSLSGSLKRDPVFKSGLCENTRACDVNGNCIEYPDKFSFACNCKLGFYGDGFVGNCIKIKDSALSFTLQLIFGCIFSLFVAEVLTIFVFVKIIRSNFF
ncbi:uncharacterized protein LOC105843752 isoform X1 [Hydra vulgaris]|uniref:uncharacterized protein LOC105843752 isoform X1 n=1 Tax=Hydra vulgaris TaxID=6087 RepID=UPI0006412051|nr:uncharacterized protein LOC105843752 [Hydra vulgaris]